MNNSGDRIVQEPNAGGNILRGLSHAGLAIAMVWGLAACAVDTQHPAAIEADSNEKHEQATDISMQEAVQSIARRILATPSHETQDLLSEGNMNAGFSVSVQTPGNYKVEVLMGVDTNGVFKPESVYGLIVSAIDPETNTVTGQSCSLQNGYKEGEWHTASNTQCTPAAVSPYDHSGLMTYDVFTHDFAGPFITETNNILDGTAV